MVIVLGFCFYPSRCVNILELSELKDLLAFHYHTLLLYCSLCALGNVVVSHALCSYIDQSQFLHAIQDPCLPGPLRSAFYQLLTQVIKAAPLSSDWVLCSIKISMNCLLRSAGLPQQPRRSPSNDEP